MMEPVAWRWKFKDATEWQNAVVEPPTASQHKYFDTEPLVRLSDAEARIAKLEEEIGRLEDENSDLRYEPWPEWARAVLKVIREHSGYDGYDDATDGVDMPLELSEHLSEMESQFERQKSRAEAAEALLKEKDRSAK